MIIQTGLKPKSNCKFLLQLALEKRCLANLNRRKNEKKGGNSRMGEWLQSEKECRKGTRPKTKRKTVEKEQPI